MERLEATTQYGVHTIWLDPAIGYQPRRIENRKSADDILNEGPVRSIKGLRRATFLIDRFEFEERDGRYLIKAFVSNDTLYYRDRVQTTETVVRIGDLNLNPTFAKDSFSPSRPIPDGTHVQVDDAPSIRYEWRGGEVVKVVDPNAVNRLGGLSFARERPWRMLAQAGLCVLVLFALGWRLARRGRA